MMQYILGSALTVAGLLATTFGGLMIKSEWDATHKEPPKERPHITLASLSMVDMNGAPVLGLMPDTPYRVIFVIKNGGDSLAMQMAVRSNWMRLHSNGGFPLPPAYPAMNWSADGSKMNLAPGDTTRHPSVLQPQPANELAGVNNGAMKVFIFGEVIYSDLQDRNYFTHFAVEYDPSTREWKAAPAYNDMN